MAPASRARFEFTACKFQIPDGVSNKIDCGNLLVPEDRSLKDSPLIQLHIAIVRSHSQNPAPDPVVYLSGGWAMPAVYDLVHLVPKFDQILEQRDLVTIDQRGVGYSEPSLDCPEIPDQVYQDTVAQTARDERAQNYVRAAQACHDRLISNGINLSAYSTKASAADMNDLSAALGYSQVNLYGISYGTRLALEVMRDYPQLVRSAILDSTYPPQKNVFVEEAQIVERSLELVAERCAADPECEGKYPQLLTVFYDLVAQLDAKSGGYLNGNALIEIVWGWFYTSAAIPYIPQYLYHFKAGSWSVQQSSTLTMRNINQPGTTTMSEGKRFCVICGEEVSSITPKDIAATNSEVPSRLVAYFNEPVFQICSFWGAKPAEPAEYEAVVSNIPALLLQGEYDAATPPSWARLAVETLSKAQYFEFPGIGHSVFGDGLDGGKCSKEIVDNFLENPLSKTDSTCLEGMKSFFITGTAP